MNSKQKLVNLIDDGYDPKNLVEGLANWLGEINCREFMEHYLGLEDEDNEDY